MAMELRGSLNLSKYFKLSSNQPKFYGKALINGVEYTLKGWEKVRQDTGEVWISLLFEDPADQEEKLAEEFAPTPKRMEPVRRPRTVQPRHHQELSDDDVPF